MGRWKRILGNKPSETGPREPVSAPVPSSDISSDAADAQALLEATALARDAFYSSLGALDSDVLVPLINPAFRGGPMWPSLRQAWSVIRRPDSTIVASNGLSDPFEQEGSAPVPLGLQMEVFAEGRGKFPDVSQSWLFDLTYQVSQHVADHGQFHDLFARYGVLSMILEEQDLPQDWLSADGTAAILIGLPAKSVPGSFASPYGEIRMAALTLLRPEELAFLERGGDTSGNRRKLAEIFSRVPDGHINDLDRAPVVLDSD